MESNVLIGAQGFQIVAQGVPTGDRPIIDRHHDSLVFQPFVLSRFHPDFGNASVDGIEENLRGR